MIKIRDDQTIFITLPDKNTKIIFPDGTEIYHDHKANYRTIKNPFNDSPIVRVHLARNNNYNLIGYGSAFAYLGYTNILERSYDGYMLEVMDKDLSVHQYIERFERNGKILQEVVRLVTHRDSSMLKINTNTATIVYNSPDPDKVLTN